MDRPDDSFETKDRAIRIARFGNVFAGVFSSGLTARAFDDVLAWQRPVMPAEPIVQFNLAFGAHRLAPDVQAAADRLLTEYGPRTRASATVLAATGFQASAARAMLATIYLLTRLAYPRRVFADVPDAEAWLLATVTTPAPVVAAARWLAQQAATNAAVAAHA